MLSAPLGLADHKGGHKVRPDSMTAGLAGTPAARIPVDSQNLGLHCQSVCVCFAEHLQILIHQPYRVNDIG
jgi:hypothetical protein